jgi:hypothetical protein
LRARPALEIYASRLRQSPGLGWAGFPAGENDRQRGASAGIAVRGAGAEHDHGRHQRDGHDVSQENGAALQERGTVAIRRMVPPQSGQMAKSASMSDRSPLGGLSAGSQAPVDHPVEAPELTETPPERLWFGKVGEIGEEPQLAGPKGVL